jgi:DNA primase
VFCFDGDRAGRQAARRALEAALPVMEDGRRARFLFLPEGEDPDSLVRARGTAGFEQLLEGAQALENYLFETAGEDADLNSLEGRARLSKQAAPLLGKLPDGVFKQLMIEALAQRTGLSSQKLGALMQDQVPVAPAAHTPATPPARPVQRRPLPPRTEIQRNPMLYATGLLLLNPDLGRLVQHPEKLAHLTGPVADLLRSLVELLHKRPESNTHMLLAHWYNEPGHPLILEAIEQAYFVPDEGAQEEFAETLKYLERSHIEQKLDSLVDKLHRTGYAELSSQEKLQLSQLLSQKHSK